MTGKTVLRGTQAAKHPRTEIAGLSLFALNKPDEYDAYEFADDMFTRWKDVKPDRKYNV